MDARFAHNVNSISDKLSYFYVHATSVDFTTEKNLRKHDKKPISFSTSFTKPFFIFKKVLLTVSMDFLNHNTIPI